MGGMAGAGWGVGERKVQKGGMYVCIYPSWASQVALVVKDPPPANVGDVRGAALIPG